MSLKKREINLPLYEQLYRELKADIEDGHWQPGEKLPSKRNLAEERKISVVTVMNAYSQLLAEGYIIAQERRGYFVADIAAIGRQVPLPVEDQEEAENYLYDFGSLSADTQSFPYYSWAKLMRQVLSEDDSKLLSEIDYKGVYELRREIARYLYRYRNMNVSPRQIVIGAGSEYLLGVIYQLLDKKNYAMENPGYGKAAKIYSKSGAHISYINVDDQGMKISQLQKSPAEVAYVTPSHHYPLGVVMPIKRRQQLLQWANQTGEQRYIIEDDYDSEIRFVGRPISGLQSIDQHGRVIYMNTFSRTLAPSMRISYLVLPPSLMEKYEAEFSFYSSTVPALEQYVLARFIAGGNFRRHLNRMRKIHKDKRDLLLTAIANSSFSQDITVKEQNAGLHFLLLLKNNFSEQEIVKRGKEHGILFSVLSSYSYSNIKLPPALVINYSHIPAAKIPQAVQAMEVIFKKGC